MSNWPAISDIAKQVKSGKLKASDLVETALKNLEAKQEYQTVIEITAERARERASKSDALVAQGGEAGRLAGVPFIAKDNFLAYGAKTTASSNILKPFEAPYQATAIERLEAEGAILIAKSNLDAFAHGSSTENSDFFVTKNPHDKTRVPGGSSGGSAAAVALDIVPFALGTDTGGSIRQPAGFCGVVGYKPTYGLVSRSGVIAMASSTDVIGPITRNLDDTAAILDIIAGRDELDSTTIEKDSKGYQLSTSSYQLNAAKIGIIREYMAEGLELGVKQVIDGAVNKLKSAGAEISEVSLPSLPLALAVYYIVCPAEVSSNLARYDGQRYGYSEQSATDLLSSYELSREKGFGAEAKRRIMIGTYVLSSGYYDAYYKKAQTVRTKIISEFADAFEKYDVLVGPTSPTTAFKIGEKVNDPLSMYLSDIMTVAANMSGNPAISIPAGLSSELPVGLQLIGPMKGDRKLLEITKACEELL
ncbi:glutaminyl-tRNA synthase (glutamine-hydrolyzing) subunit A [Candidatus Saccharibacteria bacterium RIFCSPHIGHO2_12_FULL_49_19]|nr:MAG: glutaminyl-tRNA synthase (glutamine-hydrolyzing) subunit A [Candidatus Saccharibacteria bacterium RIFCSPHIGHO2_01_FULL_49_21]OGL37592.1 MAG: glutaminyl-tRNA synthase (glutamine-hydrolyzing) subunit A [Candidatus Saccharibacteria bacterium RIFCSPHIGHO2_12_FULL_49_19]OGL38119.1 MAG: glutaminyl-tRNA synthase (glutamine-hydrolyzing) subunit A [Candidatus Saccharibacteria bacterium RIFCSPLOWO2_01_FULL_49_22]